MRPVTLTPLVILLGLGTPAVAMTPQEEAAFQQNCSGDYLRLCAQFDPGSPQVEQCFKAKDKELSPGCRSTIAAYNKANPAGRRR